MNDKQFFNNLGATYIDARKLDVKKINLKGKNILEYIKENTTVILDERGTLANDELDIWNSYVTKDEDGNVIINRNAKPFVHGVRNNEETNWSTVYEGITQSQLNTLRTAVKVIDNEVLGANDKHIMYWQTDGMTDGNSIFKNCPNLTSFNSNLSSLTDGSSMFAYCENLSQFDVDLPNLTNGRMMFTACFDFTSFSHDLPSLTSSYGMFNYCSSLTSFKGDLSSLTDGNEMFSQCRNLTSFTADLSSLTNGCFMFQDCSNLSKFTSDLSSLTNGHYMFGNCQNLTSFNADLSSLTNGESMFTNCYNLTAINANLSSLTHSAGMFGGCKLDPQSVSNIIHFIPQRDAKPTQPDDDGIISIGIGITNTDAAKQAFAEECDCSNWAELNKEFDDKNWGVQWQFNGPASYSLRDPRPSTAVYTKLEEVFMPTEEEITAAKEKGERIETPHYEYTSQDGDNYYNIHWYHDSNTINEGYDYFESLEMATLAYSVIPRA